MQLKGTRRNFFKRMLAFSACGSACIWSLNKKIKGGMTGIGRTRKALAMNNPDYATDPGAGEVRFEYRGMSCFLITAADGTRIITDPFHADKQILYPELRKESADIVSVSCGNYAHCYVYAVGGMPYIYRIKTPTDIEGIPFRGISSRHLEMKEVGPTRPDENIIMCFEVSGIRICHLGALGQVLSDAQIKEIGAVDVLMVPVGGVSTLPVEAANRVCNQLDPRVIVPMHYRSERCTYPAWAPVDTFLEGKENIVKFNGFGEFTLCAEDLPSEPHIYVPETRH